ncbi:hypothetical protein [Enterovibrio calviensis]|nr:hypothetical protein [Enterovibrio calviensis]
MPTLTAPFLFGATLRVARSTINNVMTLELIDVYKRPITQKRAEARD